MELKHKTVVVSSNFCSSSRESKTGSNYEVAFDVKCTCPQAMMLNLLIAGNKIHGFIAIRIGG